MQSLSGDNATLQFRAAMQAAGLDYPGDIIPDGRLQRFKVNGDRTPDGWYVFHPDGVPAGAFGYWKRDISETWCAKPDHYLTPAERAENERRWREAREQRDAEQRKLQKAAKTKASRIWNESPPAPADHPYLQRKGVTIPGSRIAGDKLLIPLSDASGELHTLQYIAPDGTKRLLKDGRKKGAWFMLGALANADQAYICEGCATAASVYAATGLPTVAAIDAGNLESVALAIRKAYPALTLILAADHDDPANGNIGVAKATNAARQVSGMVVYPVSPKTDFNDLHLAKGLEAVRERLALASSVDSTNPAEPIAVESAPPPRLGEWFTGSALLRAQFADPKWLVPDILPDSGCYVLSGKPKLGKSWWAYALALAVLQGGKFLNRDVPQGKVVYLALEDMPRRLKTRLMVLQPDCEQSPDCFEQIDFRTEAPRLGAGLEALLEAAVAKGGVVLIVVDTLQKVRQPGGGQNQYQLDYDAVSALKRIADHHNCVVLVLHHLRKEEAADIHDCVSGTLGITGAADGSLILRRQRGDGAATLFVTGRDMDESEHGLRFEKGIWSYAGTAAEVKASAEQNEVFEALKPYGSDGATAKEISTDTSKKEPTIRFLLRKLVDTQRVRVRNTKPAPHYAVCDGVDSL